ncbi:KamA family radical SAM protein [Marinobacter nauticus]|uniref:KamA family radical SAM protein n=1 Tax=Marinobacter nauticus TaxID=2743 RepID=UPI001F3B2C05|nr:lysine 2,3-aminomutase [Marinobacter nauticus]
MLIAKDVEREYKKEKMVVYTSRDLDKLGELKGIDEKLISEMKVVSEVLPFRVNNYVIDQLINWNNVPNDPIFQLTFPQKGMLKDTYFEQVEKSMTESLSKEQHKELIRNIRLELNPHPAGQLEKNIPTLNGKEVQGIQHKYKNTVLFFPSSGQTCHSYCTFCFRWAQFIGDTDLRMAAKESDQLQQYLRHHPEVTDILVTGGDPMVMKTKKLRVYIEPLLTEEFSHIRTIRIGTKALSFWPQRFVSDDDSDDLINFFSEIKSSGKHLAIMAHYNHWQELSTDISKSAIKKILNTGAVIRSQGPLLRHINDKPEIWSRLWQKQVELGIIPYYMFVERDTGACNYFEIPLFRAWEIYQSAIQKVSGVARTARGPSMSADPGKVEIQGIIEIDSKKYFVLRFIQGRVSDWVQRPFLAEYSETATWLNHLKSASNQGAFFFEADDNFKRSDNIPLHNIDTQSLIEKYVPETQ